MVVYLDGVCRWQGSSAAVCRCVAVHLIQMLLYYVMRTNCKITIKYKKNPPIHAQDNKFSISFPLGNEQNKQTSYQFHRFCTNFQYYSISSVWSPIDYRILSNCIDWTIPGFFLQSQLREPTYFSINKIRKKNSCPESMAIFTFHIYNTIQLSIYSIFNVNISIISS